MDFIDSIDNNAPTGQKYLQNALGTKNEIIVNIINIPNEIIFPDMPPNSGRYAL